MVIDGVGEILFNHYKNPLKLKTLIELGSISCLGEEIGAPGTVVYARDKEEELEVFSFKDFADYEKNHNYEEYEYIQLKSGTWCVYDSREEGVYISLESAIARVKEKNAE